MASCTVNPSTTMTGVTPDPGETAALAQFLGVRGWGLSKGHPEGLRLDHFDRALIWGPNQNWHPPLRGSRYEALNAISVVCRLPNTGLKHFSCSCTL